MPTDSIWTFQIGSLVSDSCTAANSMPEQTHPLNFVLFVMAWPVFRFVCWPIDYRALFHSE